MKKQDIIDYVLHSPHNTNAAILNEMIDEWVNLQNYLEDIGMTKITDFLYSATYNDWNYAIGRKATAEEYKKTIGSGGCSSIRKGNLYGRNYDWFYNNQLECIVRCKGHPQRHASMGIAKINLEITPESIESGKYNEAYEIMPFHTLDGKNDAGVVCSINVCPPGDKGYTIGTNPDKPDLCAHMIPRYVLDYADNARHGVELLNNVNIYGLYSDTIQEEIHAKIADKNSTYIVEFINNKIHVMSDQDDEFDNLPNDAAIMTNFHLTDFNGEIITGFDVEGGIKPEDTTLEPHANGLERYKILLDGQNSITDENSMFELMKSIRYTNAYDDSQNPYWYSELAGKYGDLGELTIYDNKEKYQWAKDYFKSMYEHRTREKGDTWQTVHTSIYNFDKDDIGVTVYIQETNDKIYANIDDSEEDILIYDGGNLEN